MDCPPPFEIAPNEYGAVTADNGHAKLVLRDADGRIFRRRAVKNFTELVEWSVAELGGVRVYFDGTNVVVTRKDLRP